MRQAVVGRGPFRENQQRRGFGRRMLDHVLAHAAAACAKWVTVGTGNSSLRQLAFHQRAGFRVTGVVPDYFDVNDPPIVEHRIRCRDMIRLSWSATG